MMRTLPAESSMMFAGLRSRWTTPRSCAAASPAASCRASSTRPVFRKPADPFERRREILAVDVLHREIQIALDLADVVDATDVGMRDLPRRPDLVVKLREPARVGREILRQEFQRHGLAEAQIVGAVDLAHPAAAEQSDHAVPAVEHGARRESPVIDRARRAQPPARRRPRSRAARRTARTTSPVACGHRRAASQRSRHRASRRTSGRSARCRGQQRDRKGRSLDRF